MNNRTVLLAPTLFVALVLSACGGGGGGGASGAPAPAPAPTSQFSAISVANSTMAASNAHAANATISTSSSTVTDALTGVTIDAQGISAVAPALGLINRAYNRGAPTLLAGVAMTQSCSGGGTIAFNGTVKSANFVSNGDSINVTTTNCVESGMLMNGAFALAFSGISGLAFDTAPWAATIDARFDAFRVTKGSDTIAATGDMKIVITQTSASANSVSITGKLFQAADTRAGTTVSNFTLTDFSLTGIGQGTSFSAAANYTLSGNTPALGQFAYSVKNVQPFVSIGGSLPTAGSFIVNGAASSVTMSVVAGGNVQLDYSAKGDGVVTQTSTVPWASFLASM